MEFLGSVKKRHLVMCHYYVAPGSVFSRTVKTAHTHTKYTLRTSSVARLLPLYLPNVFIQSMA